MKLEIVLILCCVALAHSLKIVNQNNAGSLACCGSGRTYDTTTQICCINSVFSIPDADSNKQAACCGTNLLNNDQICCPAVPGAVSTNDRAIANNLQCCGNNGFNSANQLCCDGSVVSSNNNALQCCGSRTFNPTTDLCCAGSTVANGATNQQTCCGTTGQSSNQLCCFNRVVSNANGNLQCCDAAQYTTAFDASTQTCCDGVVNSGANSACCGTRSLNAANQLCCSGTVVANPNGNLQCCGTRSFDPATQTCCSVDVTTVTSTGKDCAGCKQYTTVITTQFQVGNIPQSQAQCCGLTAFDTSINQCCLGRVNPLTTSTGARTCCGTTTYNAAADLCCPNAATPEAVPIVGGLSRASTQCCGTGTYNTTTQTCLCAKPIALAQDIDELGGDAACCGTTQYNNISATCCSSEFGNFLYPLQPAAGWKCCPQDGKSLYNPGYQICCDRKKDCPAPPTKLAIRDVEELSIDFRPLKGQFHPRDSHDFDSLLDKRARATRDIEEEEVIEEVEDLEKKKKKKNKNKKNKNKKSGKADSRDRTSGNIANNDKDKFELVQCGDSCCNGQGYFGRFQLCCGDEHTGYNVIDVSNSDAASSQLACCGNNIYNTQHESCCEEIKSIDSCLNTKANYGIYDPAAQLCCTD